MEKKKLTSINNELKEEVKRSIDNANKAIDKYGRNCIELNIDYSNDEEYEGVIMFHSRHNSFKICDVDVDFNNEEIKDYVIKEFNKAEIDICEN